MEPLYLNISQNVEVDTTDVTLDTIAKLTSSEKNVVARLKTMKIIKIKDKKFARYIVSVMAIIEKIHEIYPTLEIVNIGEPEFVLTFRKKNKESKIFYAIKLIFICVAAFFGAAFSIMTFNNDVGINELFAKIYEEYTGQISNGFTILEISYSLGIAVGIIVFFNHFFGRNLSTDPTPLEVEMKIYEKDINTMLIESCSRKEQIIDVD